MKNKILKGLCYLLTGLIFLTGLLIFIFPLINRNMINTGAESELEIFRTMKEIQADGSNEEKSAVSGRIEFDKLYKDMSDYNKSIYEQGQSGLTDAWAYMQAGFDLSDYGLYNGVVAEIRIPDMNCNLPLYLGATNYNMSQGAAQLGQTSTPIGGINTNCVIAAHRGSAGGDFFKDIQVLELGDKIYIDNFWETLTYEVAKIEIIYPDDISKVLIQEGKDMVTLITCHPYPYNSQRYVVYCQRTENDEIQESESTQEPTESTTVQPTKATQITEVTESPIQTEEAVDDSNSQLIITLENISYVLIPICLALLAVTLAVIGSVKKKKEKK